MKKQISKELLSEVLGYTISSLYIAPNKTFIEVHSEGVDKRFNTYELVHKCKKWALHKGFTFNVQMGIGTTLLYCGTVDMDFDASTEPEAVFKACQWILDNKELNETN